MRIHSNILRREAFVSAAREAGVYIISLTECGSKSHAARFDVYLTGSHYAMTQYGDRDMPAATWDEWGNFLAYLYKLDPQMVAGQYKTLRDFIDTTQDDLNRFRLWDRTKNPALVKTAPWLRDQNLRALA